MHDPTCAAYTSDTANGGQSGEDGNTESNDEDKTNLGLIVGPIVAAVLLIGGGLGAFFFLRWRKMKKMKNMGADASHSSTTKVKIMAADPLDFNPIEPPQIEMAQPEKKKSRKKKKKGDVESMNGIPQHSSVSADSLDYN